MPSGRPDAPPLPPLAVDGGPPAVSEPLPFTAQGRELIGAEEEANLLEVVRSRRLNRYELPYHESFCGRVELALERLLGVRHVHLTASGSLAAGAAFVAAGLGPGDEVIVPALTWQTVPYALVALGAVPVVAQVDETLTLDLRDAERLVTPRTRAIVPVHLHGRPADLAGVEELARRHRLIVVEDVCQAAGGSYRGRRLGAFGRVSFFSTNYMKLLASGDGGFVASDDDAVYAGVATYLGAQVLPPEKRHCLAPGRAPIPATQARATELMGAVLLPQVERLDGVLERLRAVRDAVLAGLRGCRAFEPSLGHDPQGDCGFVVGLRFPSAATCQRFGNALRAEGVPMAFSRDHWNFFSPAELGGLVDVRQTHAVVTDPRAGNARSWTAVIERVGLHPQSNPWTHPAYTGEAPRQGPELMDASFERLGPILFLRLNVRLTPRHGDVIAAAVRKVDHWLGREPA
jgi:dTDP-4-amino-4,6-dideoxygalactose transaminase